MKASLRWIKEYVDIARRPAEIARRLTLAGLEVKDTETTGDWENIVVGQIVDIQPHPNADRLKLTTVDVGKEKITVVTGAPNLRLEDKVPFAFAGAELIDGHTGQKLRLKPAKIRGILSSGMVCSEKELGISDSHEGIMELPPDAPVGAPLAEYLGDTIFNFEITPNRADCLSIIGIAREIAALTGQKIREPEADYEEAEPPVDRQIWVEILDPDLCPRYCASLITGIKIAPSPDWMQHRLIACGMRPINNIVDITNYVMLEHGQPLHAFDYTRIGGKKIIVRRAAPGEPLTTLDGTQRTLSPDMLVIADASHPVAVAGVMGGADSEVADATTSILLEAANFKPSSIYHTGHTLGLPSEARIRFERGIRPELAPIALRRATRLIAGLGGGRAARGIIDVYPGRAEPQPVKLSVEQAKRILGIGFSLDQIASSLSSLGFECKTESQSEIRVVPPYWRNDIRLDVDLIEEAARIIGYDRIPTTMLSQPIPRQDPDPALKLRQDMKQALVGYGFQEIITYSLVGLEMLQKLVPERAMPEPMPLRVANPMTAEQEYLRPTLRGSLLAGFAANRRHEEGGIRLFELDKVYIPQSAGLPQEKYVLSAVLGGARLKKSWYGGAEPVDFFDAKGIAEGLLDRLDIGADFAPSRDRSLHPANQAAVIINGKTLGALGEVHPVVRLAFEITEPVYLIELDINALVPYATAPRRFQPIPRFPAITRDIALVVDRSITHRQITDIIRHFPLVQSVEIFDVYSGEQVPTGKKSLAYRVVFQSPDHTLTDEEANRTQQQILDRLARELGASLRA